MTPTLRPAVGQRLARGTVSTSGDSESREGREGVHRGPRRGWVWVEKEGLQGRGGELCDIGARQGSGEVYHVILGAPKSSLV